MKQQIQKFLFPKPTRQYLVRILIVAFAALLTFKYILIPIRIQGRSMEPTYKDGGFNFYFKLRYLLDAPGRFDVVAVRMAGEKVILLKRIVALEGETIEIRNGRLFINHTQIDEPYLKYPSHWNLLPRTVKPHHVYVIGDNRSVSITTHKFGQTPVSRIAGGPLW